MSEMVVNDMPIKSFSDTDKVIIPGFRQYGEVTLEEGWNIVHMDENYPKYMRMHATSKLNRLIGMESVKKEVKMMGMRAGYEKMRNKKLGEISSHLDCPRFVFKGNPGTGKTTVARIIGDICFGTGLLSKPEVFVEVSRADLVADYIGGTSKKTKEACDAAHGGVLFIDEAYSLVQKAENDFGREAIDVLIREMEDNRNDLVVILAGYSDEMDELLNTNPGLKSRITDIITFEDYSSKELLQIAEKMASARKYTLTEDGKKAFEYLINQKKVDKRFGNAREVSNILEKAISRKAMLYKMGEMSSLTELTAKDFDVDLTKDAAESAKDLLDELDRMIGLTSVKKDVRNVINKARYIMQDIEEGIMSADQVALNMNLCFTGNPGTGKTTVARIYARLLHSIGLAKTDKVYEVSRSDLIGEYMGSTALKTKAACERAYGGVLFIDEAYSLVEESMDSFGREALDTLIKEMEDNRDKMVVIFAGYTKEMRDFMERNSGLRSRISKFIEFEDYSVEDLCRIFDLQIQQKGCVIDSDAKETVKQRIGIMTGAKDRTFGNAREIRNLTEEIYSNMVTRVVEGELTGPERKHIVISDVTG